MSECKKALNSRYKFWILKVSLLWGRVYLFLIANWCRDRIIGKAHAWLLSTPSHREYFWWYNPQNRRTCIGSVLRWIMVSSKDSTIIGNQERSWSHLHWLRQSRRDSFLKPTALGQQVQESTSSSSWCSPEVTVHRPVVESSSLTSKLKIQFY